MNDTVRFYLVMLALLVMNWSASCGANPRGDKVSPGLPLSQQLPESPSHNTSDKVAVRFVPEPIEAPQPGTEGSFLDELHAWVTGELEAKGTREGKRSWGLARTIDGGQTWVRLRPSPEAKGLDWLSYSHWRVRFVSPTRGWLTGNDSTWQTDDGGVAWRQIFAASFEDAQFADEQRGWMNIANSSGQQSYVTEDGGQTWQPCGPKRAYSQQIPGHNSYFLTPQIGWAVTSKADKKDPRITVKGVAKSTDGGCTWNQLWVNRDPDARYSDIYFLNDNEGWLVGEMTLLHTSDGGRSWLETLRPTDKTNVFQVYFVNSKEGWIISGYPFMPAEDTGLYRTTNGGKTWRQLSESEIVDGFDENGRRVEMPGKWKAGKLLQMLYASKAKSRNK